MSPKNVWVCTEEKTLLNSPVMEIVQRDCRSSEDGRPHRFFLFRSRDWCNVIPVTEDGKVVMVRQYRIGISEHTLEIPGGVSDPGDADAAAAAVREMTEETGYVPLPGARCVDLGWTYPNPAIQDNRVHSYLVGPVRLERGQKLDTGEMIEVVEVPIAELPDRIARGEIRHALILNAFLLAALREPSVAESLRKVLGGFAATRGNHE